MQQVFYGEYLFIPFLQKKSNFLIALVYLVLTIGLPLLGHYYHWPMRIFVPIHWFVLFGSFLYGWAYGIIIALSIPLLNNLLVGVPQSQIIVAMCAEMFYMASIAAITMALYKNKWLFYSVFTVLLFLSPLVFKLAMFMLHAELFFLGQIYSWNVLLIKISQIMLIPFLCNNILKKMN